ncbi:hypothetical protein FIBSPDRAFT_937810 [Athelia psychrophila]|uniref:Uncharacterized protein n=1 Tax=Athelia psychrophila TaxID=1759441 RepID=A0A165ZRW5_9AGAM|nr:hypothetical protein FIBSPDRAFT_937810 [Fibularhizoctonia sp. CBS 109695]
MFVRCQELRHANNPDWLDAPRHRAALARTLRARNQALDPASTFQPSHRSASFVGAQSRAADADRAKLWHRDGDGRVRNEGQDAAAGADGAAHRSVGQGAEAAARGTLFEPGREAPPYSQLTGASPQPCVSSVNRVTRLITQQRAPVLTQIDIHAAVPELVKGVLSMGAPPGAGLTECLQNSPASNCFAREIGQRKLDCKHNRHKRELPERAVFRISAAQAISIIIEPTGKDKASYVWPYLFHTLRNRLVHTQQHTPANTDDGRNELESGLGRKCGHGHSRERSRACARSPGDVPAASASLQINGNNLSFWDDTSVLIIEMLHCSNMAIMNRGAEFENLYDADGRLQGGLQGLEQLEKVLAIALGSNQSPPSSDSDAEVSRRLPTWLALVRLNPTAYSAVAYWADLERLLKAHSQGSQVQDPSSGERRGTQIDPTAVPRSILSLTHGRQRYFIAGDMDQRFKEHSANFDDLLGDARALCQLRISGSLVENAVLPDLLCLAQFPGGNKWT